MEYITIIIIIIRRKKRKLKLTPNNNKKKSYKKKNKKIKEELDPDFNILNSEWEKLETRYKSVLEEWNVIQKEKIRLGELEKKVNRFFSNEIESENFKIEKYNVQKNLIQNINIVNNNPSKEDNHQPDDAEMLKFFFNNFEVEND